MEKLLVILEREVEKLVFAIWIIFQTLQRRKVILPSFAVLDYETRGMGRNYRAEEAWNSQVRQEDRLKKERQAKMLGQDDCITNVLISEVEKSFADWANAIILNQKDDFYFSVGDYYFSTKEHQFDAFGHGRILVISKNSALVLTRVKSESKTTASFGESAKTVWGIVFVKMDENGVQVALLESFLLPDFRSTDCVFESCEKKEKSLVLVVRNNHGTKNFNIQNPILF